MKYEMISHRKDEINDFYYIMTIRQTPSLIEKLLFFEKTKTVGYKGNCTVWFILPKMERAGTLLEHTLYKFYEDIKKGEETQ